MNKWLMFSMGICVGAILAVVISSTCGRHPTALLQTPPSVTAPSEGTNPITGGPSPKILFAGDLGNRNVGRIDVVDGSIGDCFLQLAVSGVAPIGLELFRNDYIFGNATSEKGFPVGTGQRFSLSMKDATLKSVLDAIVAADPRYVWDDARGTVSIRPADGTIVAKPFESTIDVFVAVDLNLEEVLSLATSPMNHYEYLLRVLRKDVNDLNLKFRGFPSMRNFDRAKELWTKRMTFVLLKPTLRDLLNEILRQQGTGSWVLWSLPIPNSQDPGATWQLVLCPDLNTF